MALSPLDKKSAPTTTTPPTPTLPHRLFQPDRRREPEMWSSQGRDESTTSVRHPVRPILDEEDLLPPEARARAERRMDRIAFYKIEALLILLTGLAYAYRLEGRAFQIVLTMVAIGLPIYEALGERWRRPFVAWLTVVALGWVFGPVAAALVVGLTLGLIGICLAPIPWAVRAGIVAGVGVGLMALRNQPGLPVPAVFWPVAGSFLMFRMVIYLYELKHAKKPESFLDAVNYFLLPPNACFIHFPVVDYRTMQRTWLMGGLRETQREGLRMIFRGMIHLLGYRIIYHELLIAPGDVEDPATLARFLVCNYLLYLRVSGQFHIACGIIHLFGWRLPETHHNYLLANSFTDYWRRINIYWKDFMVRVFFNPTVFRLKRWPQPLALAAATVVVFLATWLLHAYQSFWLRGSWGFSTTDGLFWGILGVLVLINVQIDARRTRAGRRFRPLKATEGRSASVWRRAGALAKHSLQVAATFTTIAVLWSLWSSPGVGEWLEMMGRGLGLTIGSGRGG